MKMILLSAGFLLTILSGRAGAAYSIQVQTDVPYGSDPSQVLDICAPEGVTGPVPAFVVIHGGGWSRGDKEGGVTKNICNAIAARGYVAFNINYRLVQNDTDSLPNPDAVNAFPVPLVDAQLAVRWVRQHAADYGVDAGHVCSWGDSAGADLAVYLGVIDFIYPDADEATRHDKKQSPQVNCVISHSGAVDFTLIAQGVVSANGNLPTLQYINAPSADAEALRAASPLFYVSPQSAPMAITQGTQDTTVLPVNATELQAALEAEGVPNDLITYDGGHVFEGLSLAERRSISRRTIDWAIEHYAPVPDPPSDGESQKNAGLKAREP